MTVPQHIVPALQEVAHELVRGNFAHLEADGRSGRSTARDLQRVLHEYGCTLVDLPDAAFDIADAIRLETSTEMWRVDLPLWTREEGRSDLTLSLTVAVSSEGISTEIDDLRVM